MQFAINYSPQAVDLLHAGQIDMDRFKCPPWPDLIAEARRHRPVYIHYDLYAGNPAPQDVDWDQIEALLHDTDTPYVNLHLAALLRHFPDVPPDSADADLRERIVAWAIRDIEIAMRRFGRERVLLENAPFSPATELLRLSVEPDVFRRVAEATDCAFLLDISHARIAAASLGIEGHAYIESLPVNRLREVHVTGIHHQDGVPCDHLGLTEGDWAWFGWVLERVKAGAWGEAAPWIVAFEYGGIGPLFEWRSESGVIAAQVPRLYRMTHAPHGAVASPEAGVTHS
ncbi:MAG: DUF692 family protein [Anaerolineae bacterium]|nr:DUF692 family protein [Anaerolineae bacterium]